MIAFLFLSLRCYDALNGWPPALSSSTQWLRMVDREARWVFILRLRSDAPEAAAIEAVKNIQTCKDKNVLGNINLKMTSSSTQACAFLLWKK